MSTEPKFSLGELPLPMVYATHRTIRDCNAQFAELFGYTREDLKDFSFHHLYPKFADFVRTGQLWKANFAGGNVYYDERIMVRHDQTRFWCKVNGRSRISDDPFESAIYCFEPINRLVSNEVHILSDRQLQIVTLVAQGKTSRAIAEEIGVSVRTVESHRMRIMKALDVRNTAELIIWFSRRHTAPETQA